jgi:hypothetical protein
MAEFDAIGNIQKFSPTKHLQGQAASTGAALRKLMGDQVLGAQTGRSNLAKQRSANQASLLNKALGLNISPEILGNPEALRSLLGIRGAADLDEKYANIHKTLAGTALGGQILPGDTPHRFLSGAYGRGPSRPMGHVAIPARTVAQAGEYDLTETKEQFYRDATAEEMRSGRQKGPTVPVTITKKTKRSQGEPYKRGFRLPDVPPPQTGGRPPTPTAPPKAAAKPEAAAKTPLPKTRIAYHPKTKRKGRWELIPGTQNYKYVGPAE